MKHLLTILLLLPLRLLAQPPRNAPRLDRQAKYADSSRMYTRLMLRAKTRDSAAYYDAKMHYHRHMESWRQWVVTDSGWRSKLALSQRGQQPTHSGYYSAGYNIIAAVQRYLMRPYFISGTDNFLYGPGEYVPVIVDRTTQTAYSCAGSGIPATVPGAPANSWTPVGGPHNAAIIDKAGGLWMVGGWTLNGAAYASSGSSTMIHITQDSLGNTLDPVVNAFLSGDSYGVFWNVGIVTYSIANGYRAYVGGELEGGGEGNGTWGNSWSSKFVQVTLPGGRQIKKLQGGYCFVALATDGTVWSWGGGGYNYWLGQGASPSWTTPGQVALPGGYTATDIASNGAFSYALCLNSSSQQREVAWGQQYYEDYIGIYPSGTVGTSAQDITSYWSAYLPAGHLITNIWVGSNATYVKFDNGQLKGLGGSPCGELGIGLMLNWWTNGPFFWNFGPHECQQYHPTRIAPGVSNFDTVLTCYSNSFYSSFHRTTGETDLSGRNKAALVVSTPEDSSTVIQFAGYTNGNADATWPDALDIAYITKSWMGYVTQGIQVNPNPCINNPALTFCNFITNPTFQTISGNITATVAGASVTLNGRGKTTANKFTSFLWSQLDSTTAPAYLDLGIPTSATDVVSTALDATIPAGTYHAMLRSITNHYDTTYDSIAFTVGAPGCSNCVTLPVNIKFH